MKEIIIDCDNTFGVEGCDIDDGLAIIYSIGTGRCELLGVTTTFGNNTLEVVTPNTYAFIKRIGMGHIPVFPGHASDARQNKAASFLAETVRRYPGRVSVLGIGSLTNLYHAWLLDPDFFENVDQLAFMGGITEPLIIMGKRLNELNFSCGSAASYNVLTKGKSITIATGNTCLDVLFTKKRFGLLARSGSPFLRRLYSQGEYWFAREHVYFGHDGIYKWDVFAAGSLLCPEFFTERHVNISPDPESMKTGILHGKGTPRPVVLPVVKDAEKFQEHVYECYARFAQLHDGSF